MALVLADVLTDRGIPVSVWGPFAEHVASLRKSRQSPRLPGFRLPGEVEVTDDHERAVADAEIVVNAIPTQFIRQVWSRVGKATPSDAIVVSVAKGIETETLKRPTEILAQALGERDLSRVVVLSGPTIAAELARRLPATMVAAAADGEAAEQVQHHFSSPWLRIYTHDDALGVELAGAVKNVIALAAGMVDGLGVGYNAKSALLARGLAEICRFGVALGAKSDTFFGIAGVGDLATTCFSPEGRNRSCGERLGRGESLIDILGSNPGVVEGVPTAQAVVKLAEQLGIDMPITHAVYSILFEKLSPSQAIADLMGRRLKAERVG
jgi:glycerol-3-phosphate dehydrogenase (NAD(P)+)